MSYAKAPEAMIAAGHGGVDLSASPALVALITTSNERLASSSTGAAETGPCPANNCATEEALANVRLLIVSERGRSASNEPMIPRDAPPAPSTRTLRDSTVTPRLC